jgi:cytochrome c biogenesis protein
VTVPRHDRQPPARQAAVTRGLRQAWAEFRSMRTALVLLFVLAAGAILGSVFPQRPVSPDRVAQFLADNPGVGPLLDRLGMFDVFGSAWFTAIYLALMAALVACLVPRTRALLRVLLAAPPRGIDRLDRYRNTTEVEAPGVSPERAGTAARELLRGRGFRVAEYTRSGGAREVAAEKGYLREAGSLVFHVSIVVLLVGLALGKGFGFRAQTMVVEGSDQSFLNTVINYNVFEPGRFYSAGDLPPFELTLDEFSNAFHDDGTPADFGSHLTAFGQDGTAQEQRVAVNRPMTVDGVRVLQSDYGYAPVLRVTGPDGEVLWDSPRELLRDPGTEISTGALKLTALQPQVGLDLTFFTSPQRLERPDGGFTLGNRPQLENPLLVVFPFEGDLRAGQTQSIFSLDRSRLEPAADQPLLLAPGESAGLEDGTRIEFVELRQYSVLTLARDPGVPLVAAGGALLLAGLVPSLYVRRRRVWVRATPSADGVAVRVSGHGLQGKEAFVDEFGTLADKLREVLDAPSRSRDRVRATTLPGDQYEGDR